MICPHCLLREAVSVCLACLMDADGEDDLDYGSHPSPTAPTDTEPGSEARLRVLEARAALGCQLFHPDDCSLDWSTPWREQEPACLRHRLQLA